MAVIYQEEWATKLQEELDEPNKFKDICNVEYTNTRILHNPYLTDAAVLTGTRGCPYTHDTLNETDESTVINTFKLAPYFIDRGDLAQSTYTQQMFWAGRQAIQLNEAIETAVYAAFGSMTTFDNSEIGGAAGSITVSATNVDDIIVNILRKINQASGQTLYQRNGGFIVWRPTDYVYLQQFAMSNGFNSADAALRGNANPFGGFDYMGFTHYTSNFLSGGHAIAGVKKSIHLGILKDTYGQIMVDEKDPPSGGTAGALSGISVVSRVDYKAFVWTKMKPIVFDVRCA